MIAGLSPRALAAWCGTDRLSALPLRFPTTLTPASAGLLLFVAGATVPRKYFRTIDEDLVSVRGDDLVAKVAVLPLRHGYVVCDRRDASTERDLVPFPDDSSYHLALSLPRGAARWLDLACGSAVAAMMRPELATTRVATDLNPRAIAYAKLGARLSGIALDARVADIADPVGDRFDLISCNAPIPNDPSTAMWRSTTSAFFDGLFRRAPEQLAPGGTVVVHARRDAIPALPGEAIICTYDRFAILWWRPDAPPRTVEVSRELTPGRPHLDASDRDTVAAP